MIPASGGGLAIADLDGDLREEIACRRGRRESSSPPRGRGRPAEPPDRDPGARGRKSNRSAFGTKLVLETGGKRQIREIGAGSSYLSQNAPEAIFGLGAATKADLLTVRWPSGATATFRDLPADRTYLLVEGEAAPRPLPDNRARTLAFWDAYNGARAAFAKGDFAASIAAYRKALELDPRHEDCRYALGNLLLERGDRAEAKAEFEALLKLQPRSQRGHGALGDLLADPASGPLQDLAAARKNYESAGGIYTEETGWVVRSGEVALATGDAAGAERTFRKVLVSNPHSFQALYFLGYLASRQKRNEEEGRRLFDAAFAALGPQASPAPGEGDVRKSRKALPRRGAFAGHWAGFSQQGKVRKDDAWARPRPADRAEPDDEAPLTGLIEAGSPSTVRAWSI